VRNSHDMSSTLIFAFRFLFGVVLCGTTRVCFADDVAGRQAGPAGVDGKGGAFVCVSAVMPQSQGRNTLERVQQQYSSIETMQGNFRQDSYVAALDEGEASSGTMVFAKPGKMRWSYKAPRVQEVVIRDGELWMYQPEQGQVMIDSVGAVLLSALPVSFLMGIGNLTKDFDLVSACRTSAGVALSLLPHKQSGSDAKEEALEGFTLLVDAEKNLPKGAKIISVGGNTTAIIFENLQVNLPGVPPSRFVLEYPKGVDILDRRITPGS
jgi:outer membrane lipoprotein carrier protein